MRLALKVVMQNYGDVVDVTLIYMHNLCRFTKVEESRCHWLLDRTLFGPRATRVLWRRK
jgi:hypothetical protein